MIVSIGTSMHSTVWHLNRIISWI